jgi:hypothetical protein
MESDLDTQETRNAAAARGAQGEGVLLPLRPAGCLHSSRSSGGNPSSASKPTGKATPRFRAQNAKPGLTKEAIVKQAIKIIVGICLIFFSANAFADCTGYSGPGGPCYTGPGGGLYSGPGGGAYTGPGGGAYTGPGGGAYTGPGGGAYTGPGGGAYTGPGGGAYTGPDGGAYTGPGGGAYSGPGGPCYSGPGGAPYDQWNRPSPHCR